MIKKEFNKYNSMALKGIAIIMMMFHHCFRSLDVFNQHYVSFNPFNINFIIQLSDTFKICVSIFAFITGYGLFISFNKLYKKNCKNKNLNNKIHVFKWIITRLLKTLSGFWIIAILSYIICQLINGMTKKIFFQKGIFSGIIQIIINFLGLSSLFKTPDFNATWWYMSLAILFILLIPILFFIIKKYGYCFIFISIVFIPRILGIYNVYIQFLSPMMLGMLFAEKNFIVKFANLKIFNNIIVNKLLKFIFESCIIIILYLLYNELPNELFWEIKFGIIPVFLICYFYEFILNIPFVRNLLQFFGKHSMNIFLIHDFIRTTYLTNFIYSYTNFIKIVIVLLGLSTIISIIIELLKKLIMYDKIITNLNKKIINKIDNYHYNERNKILK